jgi:hypothetical protein
MAADDHSIISHLHGAAGRHPHSLVAGRHRPRKLHPLCGSGCSMDVGETTVVCQPARWRVLERRWLLPRCLRAHTQFVLGSWAPATQWTLVDSGSGSMP